MAYRVIDKKVNTGDTTYSTLLDFKNALIRPEQYVNDPLGYLDIISNLSTTSLSDTQKESLSLTFLNQVEVFDPDNQTVTRTRDYKDQATYEVYKEALDGMTDEDFNATWPDHASAPITRTIISKETV